MAHVYYKNAVGALIVYDITKPDSLQDVTSWIDELSTNCERSKMVIAVVANKSDLPPGNPLIIEQGRRIAETRHALFHETSAKTGKGLNELFKQLVEAVYNLKQNN